MFNHTVESIESNLDANLKFEKILAKNDWKGGGFPGSAKVTHQEFNKGREKSTYLDFISFGNYHYFVSRILSMSRIYQYALFTGQQCIENYLKSIILYKQKEFPITHNLKTLLEYCKKNYSMKEASFIHSEYLRLIIKKYDPFYEISRYPIPKAVKVKGESYAYMDGDEQYLDYFVYKIREIIELPKKGWDIFSEQGHYLLGSCKKMNPEIYSLFLINNINFDKK